MLCEICHEREATVHTTPLVPEGTPTSHLCRECFQIRGPIAGMQSVEGMVQTCHYCGAQCGFGASGSRPISIVVQGAICACRECGDDLNEYVQKLSRAVSSEEEFIHNLEAYMKTRVAERHSET